MAGWRVVPSTAWGPHAQSSVDNLFLYLYIVDMAQALGHFEQAVLLAVCSLGDDAYGRAVIKAVEERWPSRVSPGAVYATLDRLQAKDALRSKLGSGTPERGGRPRRFYAITREGIAALNATRELQESLWSGRRWPLKGHA